MNRWLGVLVAMSFSLLSACAPLVTQSPGEGLSPVNAVSEDGDKHLMLFGHDVVSYFTEGTHKMGSPAIKSVYKGVTFRFSKPENKALFDATPGKYIPQFGGYCAYGVSHGARAPIKIEAWQIVNGRLLMQYDLGVKDDFNKDQQSTLKKADQNWPGLVDKYGK